MAISLPKQSFSNLPYILFPKSITHIVWVEIGIVLVKVKFEIGIVLVKVKFEIGIVLVKVGIYKIAIGQFRE